MAPLRIIFMGTPELAGTSLRALLEMSGAQVVAVVTQPDQPKGRGMKLHASPVKEIALAKDLPVLQPARARDPAFAEQLRTLQPDLIAVTAYGQILPQAILDLPRFGCLNVHTSLLPKYRGAAPIQWAILNGDAESGVTIMKMDAGLDTGPILTRDTTEITAIDDAQTLHDRLGRIGAELLAKTIPDYVAGKIQPQPQPVEGVSHAPKIKKQDGQVDWRQPATAIWNRVRGLVPWPGAFTYLPARLQPQLLKIWQAAVVKESGAPGTVLRADKQAIVVACGTDALAVGLVQREGGRRLTAQEFLAGHALAPGEVFGAGPVLTRG
jgi:methionyl-tRNA formyltransferase